MDKNNLDKDLENEKINPVVDEDDEDDIEFDDNINIEALAQQLQQHVDIGDISNLSSEEFNKEPEKPLVEHPQPEIIQPEVPKTNVFDNFPKSECKKYVVYITPNNVDYVDNLSIDERTELINDVIRDKHASDIKSKRLLERQRYVKHLIVVCITVIIGFPVLFFAVNKSLQICITNYQQSQENFQKLYREKGKITSYQQMDIRD